MYLNWIKAKEENWGKCVTRVCFHPLVHLAVTQNLLGS